MIRCYCVIALLFVISWSGCTKEQPPAAAPQADSVTEESGETGSSEIDLGTPATGLSGEGGVTTPGDAPPRDRMQAAGASDLPPVPQSVVESANPAIDLSYLQANDGLVLVLQPARVLKNPLVEEVISRLEQTDPQGESFADVMEKMRLDAGFDARDVASVVVTVDRDVLAMGPEMIQMLMMGGMLPIGGGNAEGIPQAAPAAETGAGIEAVEESNCDDDASAERPGPDGEVPPVPPSGGGFENIPMPVAVIQFNKEIDPQSINSMSAREETQHAGKTYYVLPQDKSVFYFPAPQVLVIGSEERIRGLIERQAGGLTQIGNLVAPLTDYDAALAIDLRPLHPLFEQQGGNPMAGLIGGIARNLDSATLAVSLQGERLLQTQLHAKNPETARGLSDMLTAQLQAVRTQVAQQRPADDAAVPPLQRASQPLLDDIVSGASVSVEGNVTTLAIPRPEHASDLPEVVALMAQQSKAAAEVAIRRNNLKLIGLGLHTYYDFQQRLPGAGVTEGDFSGGKGLSWRVHLLPYLEYGDLYDQFNLDEPWDSETSKALISKMPVYFGENAEGKTSLHVFVGEGTPFQPARGARFSDFLDGMSDTVLVVEAGPDVAEIWTKPGGLEFKMDDPASVLGETGREILVLMGDGSVLTLPRDGVDAETLRNLIQMNDGQVVNLP